MPEYFISQVSPADHSALFQIDCILEQEGLCRDRNLDYICAMYDGEYRVIATGSCFLNTLRCFAVSSRHQGEGLLNKIVTHLMDVQYQRGNLRLFLYAKINSSGYFKALGFHEIARVRDTLVFMENSRDGFDTYLRHLGQHKTQGPAGAVVLNANPFTLGHQYLIETAASQCKTVHLFLVSEDASLIPFSVRKKLVLEGTAHLPNVLYHNSGPYIISSATFPSYFLKDEVSVIKAQAMLDITVFSKIAQVLNITCRYAGEEPFSQVTGIYNQLMSAHLPAAGIQCKIIPRKTASGQTPISASAVRQCLKQKKWDALCELIPASSLAYFKSPQAIPVLERICNAEDVVHY